MPRDTQNPENRMSDSTLSTERVQEAYTLWEIRRSAWVVDGHATAVVATKKTLPPRSSCAVVVDLTKRSGGSNKDDDEKAEVMIK